MISRFLFFVILVMVALFAYVRLAPTDVERWHAMPQSAGPGDYPQTGGFRAERAIAAPAEAVLAAVAQRALATPRTRLIAGGVATGMMTFETRSRIMGFPDYTTVAVNDDVLVIYGRLRFGVSDGGVNRARVLAWLAALGPLTVAP